MSLQDSGAVAMPLVAKAMPEVPEVASGATCSKRSGWMLHCARCGLPGPPAGRSNAIVCAAWHRFVILRRQLCCGRCGRPGVGFKAGVLARRWQRQPFGHRRAAIARTLQGLSLGWTQERQASCRMPVAAAWCLAAFGRSSWTRRVIPWCRKRFSPMWPPMPRTPRQRWTTTCQARLFAGNNPELRAFDCKPCRCNH